MPILHVFSSKSSCSVLQYRDTLRKGDPGQHTSSFPVGILLGGFVRPLFRTFRLGEAQARDAGHTLNADWCRMHRRLIYSHLPLSSGGVYLYDRLSTGVPYRRLTNNHLERPTEALSCLASLLLRFCWDKATIRRALAAVQQGNAKCAILTREMI